MSNPRRALIVVDVQQEYFEGALQIGYPPRNLSLANIVAAIRTASAAGIPVVVVQHESAEKAPVFAAGSAGYALNPQVTAVLHPGFKHVRKRYASVFAGTGLSEWLTEQGIDTITIVGYMTNNCDLATVIDSEPLGLRAEILSDATGAIALSNTAGQVTAEDLHKTLMVLLHSNLATVATTADWTAAVQGNAALSSGNLIASARDGRDITATVSAWFGARSEASCRVVDRVV